MLHRVFTFVSVVLSGTLLFAQSYQGGLRGIVTDSGAGVMGSAKVDLIDEATTVSRTSITNASGEYVFSALNPATYTIIVESAGFRKFERKGILIATQQFITLDVKLEVGQVSESVMVTEDVPLIESSNASNGQVLDHQKMTDLPNLGRNPFLLSKISQNVVPAGDPRFNRFQDQSGSSQISVAGGPVRGNNYLLDGVPISDITNRAVIIPSIEAVQEMKLQANTYDAEMGRTGGGVFNAYLKSGSNTLHGSAFGYAREGDWLANPFFFNRNPANAGQKQDLPFRNYGSSLGGPVVIAKLYDGKNRTFFWLVQEGYRQKSNLSQDLAVPTALERIGDFSQSSVTVIDPTTGAPFAGNKVPANRLDRVGVKVASYFHLPQRAVTKYGATNYSGSDILADRADEFTSKADHEFTRWWRANASYLHYGSKEPSGNLLNVLPASQSNLLFRKVDATQVNNILTPNPTTVISIRYGFNRFPNDVREVSAGFNPSTLGFAPSYIGAVRTLAFPDFRFQNLAELGGDATSQSVYYSRNLLASVSKFIGRHSLKAGFDYRKISLDFTDLSDTVGVWKFDDGSSTGLKTGSDLASLLLGLPSSGSVLSSTKLYTYVNYYAGFVHDDFRISNKLTLNLGLRYEWETGLAERNNDYAVGFDQNAANPLGVPAKGALLLAGKDGAPATCCDPSKTKFSPRIGVAYALNPKTTFRGGYGTFYAPSRYESSAAFAPGYSQITSFVASNDGGKTAANTLSNPFPSGLLSPVGNSLGALTGIGSAISIFDQHRKSPIVHQFSFDVQRELPGNIAFEIGYVGSRSNHLAPSGTSAGTININQLDPKYLALGSALNAPVANPFYGRGGAGAIGAATLAQYQLLLPFPEYTNVNAANDLSHARYDSLNVKAQKRFSHGLTFSTAYTWSKNFDASFASSNFLNAAAVTGPQNAYDMGAEYSLAIVDTPHRFVATSSYELPFGRGKLLLNSAGPLNYIVGGWQANVIAVYQTGFPLAIAQSSNNNSKYGFAAQRPNATGISPDVSGSVEARLDGYINPAAFSIAPAYTLGNLARTIPYRGPGQANWDASLFKDFTFIERLHAQFRAEALNAFNHPQFRAPNTSFGSANFGKITQQANFPRYIQLGFRVFF